MPTPYTPITRKDVLIGFGALAAVFSLATVGALVRERNIKAMDDTQSSSCPPAAEQRVVTCAPASAARSMTIVKDGRQITLTCG